MLSHLSNAPQRLQVTLPKLSTFHMLGDVSPLELKFVSWGWVKLVALFLLIPYCLSLPGRAAVPGPFSEHLISALAA